MKLPKIVLLAGVLTWAGIGLFALEADLALGINARNTDALGFFPQVEISANHKMAGLGFFLDVYATTDGLYPSPESQFGSLYILAKEGGISYDYEALHLSAGRFKETDLTDSPYSLFFSANNNSALGMKINYDDKVFFYESRWVQLNYNSALYRQNYWHSKWRRCPSNPPSRN